MTVAIEALISFFLVVAGLFGLVGSFGLIKLENTIQRLHAPTKATTLGVGSILLGSIVYFSVRQGLSLHEILVSLFLFLTAPVSAHLIARAALQRRCKSLAQPPKPED